MAQAGCPSSLRSSLGRACQYSADSRNSRALAHGASQARQGPHLLVLEQIRRLDLHGFGLAPCGRGHRFVPEHLPVEVERCAQQRAKRRQGAKLDAWEVPSQLLFGGKLDMTIAQNS